MTAAPFTAAFLAERDGTLEYKACPASPEDACDGPADTSRIDVPALDARLAADGYLRTGTWQQVASFDVTWTGRVTCCLVQQVTVPAGTEIRGHGEDRALTVTEAVAGLASGTGYGIRVVLAGTAGQPVPVAGVRHAGPRSRQLALVQFDSPGPHLPAAARARLACYALATDLAEAANLISR